ncbi:hypothetical protein [Streptomyces sp. A012304]|uniref:hypothetical protein n=1 Tax=Streptomyces sp. A012304 TaxID=375446 RepID=UPI00222EA32B|nr:hypothetical protein [Streptomyces sp. A012304]
MLVLSQDGESLPATGEFEEQRSKRLWNLNWTGSQLELNATSSSKDLVCRQLGDAGHRLAVEHDEAASHPFGQGEVGVVEKPSADVPALVLFSESLGAARRTARGNVHRDMWPRAADHIRKLLACVCFRPAWASQSSIWA